MVIGCCPCNKLNTAHAMVCFYRRWPLGHSEVYKDYHNICYPHQTQLKYKQNITQRQPNVRPLYNAGLYFIFIVKRAHLVLFFACRMPFECLCVRYGLGEKPARFDYYQCTTCGQHLCSKCLASRTWVYRYPLGGIHNQITGSEYHCPRCYTPGERPDTGANVPKILECMGRERSRKKSARKIILNQ